MWYIKKISVHIYLWASFGRDDDGNIHDHDVGDGDCDDDNIYIGYDYVCW